MPVVFLCHHCRSRLKVGRKKIGTEVQCPRCREPLLVPEAPAASAEAEVSGPKFGGDLFPYGIEENRATWEQMALYTYQQGIAHRHMKPEEFFPAGIMTKVVI